MIIQIIFQKPHAVCMISFSSYVCIYASVFLLTCILFHLMLMLAGCLALWLFQKASTLNVTFNISYVVIFYSEQD